MACKCIQKLQKELQKRYDSEIIMTNLALMVNPKTGKHREGFEPLRFKFRPKKKDGTPAKRLQSSFVTFSHCPFCGRKYPK